ncbi:MAG: hypothetical protein FJX73_11215 [Armatimonadetes bacterium]|nr:hypothetical protein [Armatimonadota bacterium]
MRTMLTAAGVLLALLVVSVAPAMAAGPRWAPGPGAGRGPGAGVAATIPADVHKAIETATQAAAARVLKMTPAEFEKERAAGKTLAYLAGAKGVPLQTVQTAMVNARKYAINQALASGKITKAQADALLQAGPRFGAAGRPGTGTAMGPGPGMQPGFGARPGAGRWAGAGQQRPGQMRGGRMHRFGPGR